MEDLPKTIADYLESTANKVRAMTVDRAAAWVIWVTVGIILAIASLLLGIFLLVGVFRLIETLVGSTTLAYAIVSVVFMAVGFFLWSKRLPKSIKQQ